MASGSPRSSSPLYLPLRGTGASVALRQGAISPPAKARASIQSVPEDSLEIDEEDDLLGSKQTSLRHEEPSSDVSSLRSSVFDMRISMAPSSERKRETWLSTRGSAELAELPQKAYERRTSLALPLDSSARSSRTVTPSEAPFSPALPAARALPGLEDGDEDMHIAMPSATARPQSFISTRSDSTPSDADLHSRNVSDASATSLAYATRVADTHPAAKDAPKLQPALPMSAFSPSSSVQSSPAQASSPERKSEPTPRANNFRFSSSNTFSSFLNADDNTSSLASSFLSTRQKESAGPSQEPVLTLDFSGEAGQLFDSGFEFGELESGLADSLGAGLDLSFADPLGTGSSARAPTDPSSRSSNSKSDSPHVSGLRLSSLSDFPKIDAQRERKDSGASALLRRSLGRSRTPSVPVSPTVASSTHPKASFEGDETYRDAALSATVHLSPELEGQRRANLPLEAVLSTLKGHMRKVSGSDGAVSAKSGSSGKSRAHQKQDSVSSSQRHEQSPSPYRYGTPQLTQDHASSSSTSVSMHSPPKRRQSQSSLLGKASSAMQSHEYQRPVTADSALQTRVDKSLPPTPVRSSRSGSGAKEPPPRETPPPMPAAQQAEAVDGFGSLRKNAALALKKSKGLLRSKKPDPLHAPVAERYSPVQRRPNDGSSTASSVEVPITIKGPAQASPSVNGVYPRGARSGSTSSLNVPRMSSESKRSASLVYDTQTAAPPTAKKVERLRRDSDTVPAGPRPPTATSLTSKPPEPRSIPRQPTTSELLDAAAVKLQALVQQAQGMSGSGGSSRDSFPPDLSSRASIRSSASSPPPEETATVTKATRIQPGSTDSPASPKVVLLPTRSIQQQTAKAPPPTAQGVAAAERSPASVLSASLPRPVNKRSDSKQSVRSAETKSPAARPLPPPPLLGPSWRKRKITFDASGASSSVLASNWVDVANALESYRTGLQQGQAERTTPVTMALLPFLKRAELGQEKVSAPGPQAKRQRSLLFDWLDVLVDDLRDAPSNRGVCLEGVAAIAECRFLSAEALAADAGDEKRYYSALVCVLAFAIERLNEKAVYANTLAFSGRMLAVAFFRIEGVALKLLRLLPQVKRMELRRLIEEAGLDPHKMPPPTEDIFPAHLKDLCFRGLQAYCSLFSPMAPNDQALLVESETHSVTMSGNWLIRWCASDSDLPFAFYRAYHRQLASYLQLPVLSDSNPEAFLPIAEALTAPGYLFISASLLEKAESLIHRNMRSVTTLGPNSGSFNTLDSANLSTGAKPKVLEMANRRVVSTMLDIVGGSAMRPQTPNASTSVEQPEGLARRRVFGGVLQLWLRCIVKRTSLFDARGIFLLLDFLESMFFAVCSPAPPPNGEREPYRPSVDALILVDSTFVISVAQTILEKADNTVVLMRTIAFLYSLFDIFTLRSPEREQLCDQMLLKAELFQRLFLFWNTSVRGYFQRLVVWRLSRLGQTNDGRPPSTKDPWIFQTLQTLNMRLEGIRRRHNELDPLEDLPEDDLFDDRRLSVSSTRGVSDQPWFVEELRQPSRHLSQHQDDLPPLPGKESRPSEDSFEGTEWGRIRRSEASQIAQMGGPASNKAASKALNWLKSSLNPATRKLAGKGITRSESTESARIDPYALEISMPAETVRPSQRSPLEAEDTAISYADFPHRVDSIDAMAPDEEPALEDEQDTAADEPFVGSPPLGGPPLNGPSFFSFEFETDAPRSDAFDARKSVDSKRKSTHSARAGKDEDGGVEAGSQSPIPRRMSGVSPRVSKRFSKRASILPPPAIDLLFETSEPVPAIPVHFRSTQYSYDVHLHPYAVRGLREYEESLDELEIWLLRVKDEDEELADRDLADLVPRLGVAWPISFDD